MTTKDTPDWCIEFLREWRNRLLLHEWSVKARLSPAPNDDASGDTQACVELWPNIRQAIISIHDSIPDEPDDEWRQALIHELMHVRLAGVTEPLLDDLIPQLGASAAVVAEHWMRREIEEATDLLAFILWRAVYDEEESEAETVT